MVDSITSEARSRNMTAIRSTGMKPEMLMRSMVHRMGCRYRLHAKDLPGKPDMVFRKRKKVIFVHGCFWHQHPNPACKDGRPPKSNLGYWAEKLARNVARDARVLDALAAMGWRALVIWECEALRGGRRLEARIRRFLH